MVLKEEAYDFMYTDDFGASSVCGRMGCTLVVFWAAGLREVLRRPESGKGVAKAIGALNKSWLGYHEGYRDR